MNKERYKILLFFSAIGLVFIILAWLIQILISQTGISFTAIYVIHKENPILFLIDVIPILFVYIGIKGDDIWKRLKSRTDNILSMFGRQTENINKVSKFAEEIGNGKFDAEYQISDENDILGKALISLRDKLKANQEKETVVSWKMRGKEIISAILREHTDLNVLSYEVIVNLIKYINVIQGAIYLYDEEKDVIRMEASYAYNRKKYLRAEFKIGQGLVGEACYERDYIYRTEIPEDYVTVTSGILGDKKPTSLLIVPMIIEEKLQGALEFASLEPISDVVIDFVKEVSEIIARTIYNLKINEKTERLLKESQQMTEELKLNEEKLRQNAREMKETQEQLRKTNEELQEKIEEINRSQKRLYSLLENASEIISIFDSQKNIKYISPSVRNILGYSEEELTNGKFISHLEKDSANVFINMLQTLLENPFDSVTIEYQFVKKDGNVLILESVGKNMLNDPAIEGIIVNTRDITVRKLAEKEQRIRGQMQSLSENSPDVIIRTDPNGTFYYSNPKIEEYTGFKPKDIYKKNLSEVNFKKEFYYNFSELLNVVKEKLEKVEKEIEIPVEEETRIMLAKAIPEFSEYNQLESILTVLTDITERKQIELQLKEKNQKITESINYSQRIQSCILPDTKYLQKFFPDSFIFYKPKDVVSGDFPWFYNKGDYKYVAAVDCTGHGVPGAMLSLVAYFILNEIVSHDVILTPGEVLNKMHENVIKTLKQDQAGAYARDGMDVALCMVDMKEKVMHFAGAHRPLLILRNGEIIEIKGTRSSIGGIPKEGEELTKFENHSIPIMEGDSFFFFSDGLQDQFGGPLGRKYMIKRIKEILIANKDQPMNKLHRILRADYEKWIENEKQIDDVLFIGIRFNNINS